MLNLWISSGILFASAVTPTINTTKYFSSWLYFLVPAALILFSLYIIFFKDIEWILKAKRFYYSICVLIYILMLKNVNLIGLAGDKGLFGISNKGWTIIVFTIIFFLAVIIIDNWIISGYAFKEFGFFGAKFIRDEAKTTVIGQEEYIHSLEDGIAGALSALDDIKILFSQQPVLYEIQTSNFDYSGRFGEIARSFYKHRKLGADVELEVYESSDISDVASDIRKDHHLSLLKEQEIKRILLKKKESIEINKKNYNLLLITSTSRIFPDDGILIKVKCTKGINLYDRYIILNILRYFELYLVFETGAHMLRNQNQNQVINNNVGANQGTSATRNTQAEPTSVSTHP